MGREGAEGRAGALEGSGGRGEKWVRDREGTGREQGQHEHGARSREIKENDGSRSRRNRGLGVQEGSKEAGGAGRDMGKQGQRRGQRVSRGSRT